MKLGLKVRSIALFQPLDPGLVTGAADDDPSGMATYWQARAQFGFGLLWTMALMVVISRHEAMGKFTATPRLERFGWLATAVMAAAAVAMLFVR